MPLRPYPVLPGCAPTAAEKGPAKMGGRHPRSPEGPAVIRRNAGSQSPFRQAYQGVEWPTTIPCWRMLGDRFPVDSPRSRGEACGGAGATRPVLNRDPAQSIEVFYASERSPSVGSRYRRQSATQETLGRRNPRRGAGLNEGSGLCGNLVGNARPRVRAGREARCDGPLCSPAPRSQSCTIDAKRSSPGTSTAGSAPLYPPAMRNAGHWCEAKGSTSHESRRAVTSGGFLIISASSPVGRVDGESAAGQAVQPRYAPCSSSTFWSLGTSTSRGRQLS